MNVFWSVFLGTLQGLTEFLPVSSSGHLVLAQKLVPNFSQPGVFFDTILHFGTLFSILIYFRKSLLKIKRNYLYLLVIGTIPAAVLGLLFQSFIESLFLNLRLVGMALIITAVMNFLTDRTSTSRKTGSYKSQTLLTKSALYVGFFQALAIVPGISRSGATIFAGTKAGIDKKQAAEFSFYLSIPAVLGANLMQFFKYGFSQDIIILNYLAGFLAAFISGHFAISIVFRLLQKRRFIIFAVYCLLMGVGVLIF